MKFDTKLAIYGLIFFLGFFAAGKAKAASSVYFSVGQNTTTHETGAGTVTVSGTTATFTIPQTATNMGVGDVIDYDTDNKKCYISGKTSTSVWSCTNATGGTPTAATNATVNSISHAFSSLSGALPSGAGGAKTLLGNSDLTAIDVQLNIACYYDSGADETSVRIESWTTDANRYIKVYTPNNTLTEANQSQRHSGKWTTDKYYLSITDYTGLFVRADFVRIDGLQLTIVSPTIPRNTLTFDTASTGNNDYQVSNSILKGYMSDTHSQIGFYLADADINFKAWNNIVYDIHKTASGNNSAFYINANTAYLYNNTVYTSYFGYRSVAGTVVIKNNVAYDCTNGFQGTFTSSDYNISDIAGDTTGISSSYREGLTTTVSFADLANDDYHLSSTDTGARNHGTDQVREIGFTTDIDGDTRPAAATWDIGADEKAFARIYRSVGPSATDAIDSGSVSDTLTISGTAATFSTAVDNSVGVGDVIQFDIGGTYHLAFIHGRTDSTHYAVATVSGTAPQAVSGNTNWNIYRAYTSLANAEMGNENDTLNDTVENFDDWIAGGAKDETENGKDVITSDEQWNIVCYSGQGGAADASTVEVNSWVTDSDNYVRIYTPYQANEVGISQRHQGAWDDSKYRLEVANVAGISVQDNYIYMEGLQVRRTSSNAHNSACISVGTTDNRISDSILRQAGNNSYAEPGILVNDPSGTLKVWNTVIYGLGSYVSSNNSGISYFSASSIEVYNSTIIGGYRGIYAPAAGVITAKNCYALGSITAYYNVALTTSASSDATGSVGLQNIPYSTANFQNVTSGSENLHLVTGSALKNAGTDTSGEAAPLNFVSDIDGQKRPLGASWDVGADEEGAKAVYYSVGQSTSDLKTGLPTIAITNGVATFSVAQTGNIGVGDRITYSGGYAYISAKTSTTQWSVVTAAGLMPPDITAGTSVTSITHEYTTLESAIAGALNSSHLNTGDLAAGNYALNIPCYYDSAADTTAAEVNGYTTGSSNYIKIYAPNNISTEANNSQRHSGKWDSTKYRMEISFIASGSAINVDEEYTRIEGLQMQISSNSSYNNFGVSIYVNNVASAVQISSTIMKTGTISAGSGSTSLRGINNGAIYNASNNVYAWNNLIYGFNAAGSNGLAIFSYADPSKLKNVYAYNNTIIDCDRGLYSFNGTAVFIAKNNIVKGSGDTNAYIGTFSDSDYNATDGTDNTGQGINSRVSQTFAFADETNDDFHLAANDTGAREYGVDLDPDPGGFLNITSDIDGNARPALGAFDIGADEGATAIYRSAAPDDNGDNNLAAIDTGTADSNALTISGSTATFTIAVPDNVGVGDALQYDDDGDSDIDTNDSIAFITGRIDSQHYTVKTASGAAPTAVAGDTDWSILRAYTSLSYAETGTENTAIDSDLRNFDSWSGGRDIATNNEKWNIACYANGTTADTATLTINGWTTGPTNYINIYTPFAASEAGTSQRHNGKWDSSKYKLEVNNNTAAYSYENYVRITGLQIKITSTSLVYHGISLDNIDSDSGGEIIIDANIIEGHMTGVNATYAITSQNLLARPVVKAYNNIIYGFTTSGAWNGRAIFFDSANTTMYAYNNTVTHNDIAFNRGITYGGTLILKNNIAQDNITHDYYGTIDSTSTNNVTNFSSSDGGFGASAETGTTTSSSASKLIDSSQNFSSTVRAGMIVKDSGTNYTYVTAIDSDTQLTLANDYLGNGEAYTIYTTTYGNVAFINENSSDYDFHLSPEDAAAKGKGIKLASYADDANLNFTVDVDGDTRDANWSAGADEGGKATVQASPPDATESPGLDINNGLVLYQSFDGDHIDWGNSTAEARDQSGQNNHGDVAGATTAIGKRGQGLEFDTVDDYINNGSATSLDNLPALTLSVWAKPSGWGENSAGYLMSKSNIGTAGWRFSLLSSMTSPQFSVDYDGATDLTVRPSAGSVTFNEWAHWIVTWDGTANASGVHIYKNGTEVTYQTQQNGAGNHVSDATHSLLIGNATVASPDRTFDGALDEARVYNRVISADEIGQLYRMGEDKINMSLTDKMTNGLIGMWSFDGLDVNMATNTAYDRSPIGTNHGTISGVTPVMGKKGQGMEFDGETSYINAGSASSLDDIQATGTGMTVSLWVRNDQYSDNQPFLISKGSSNNNGFWIFFLDGSNHHVRFIKDFGTPGFGDGDLYFRASYSSTYLGQWKYVAMTWDGSSSVSGAHIYIDGTEISKISSSDGTGSAVSDAALNLFIGNDSSIGGPFDGLLDEIRIYNRVLSAEEIGDLYRMGQGKISQ